jgi:low temperature requirement protein LtrA
VAPTLAYSSELWWSLLATFGGGIAAGVLSRGGARAGIVSGFLAGVLGYGVPAIFFLARATLAISLTPGGSHFVEGLTLFFIPILGAVVLTIAFAGGALGGLIGKLVQRGAVRPVP